MATFELSTGAIREVRINASNCVPEPVLQCLSVKKVGNNPNGGVDRYRAILSDGQTFLQAMFATQLNPLAEDGTVGRFTVCRILEYTVNMVKDKTIIIIHQVEVLGDADQKIGEPASVDVYIQAENDAAAGGNGEDAQMDGAGAAAAPDAYAPPANRGGGAPARGGGAAGRGGNNNNNNSSRSSTTTSMNAGQQHPIYPIEGLSPYQNKWTIKARVTNKSDIRHWSNAKGEGKLFSVVFLDETGEIKATGFNDAVDQFYNLLEDGKVYFVSKARVGIAKKQFSNVNNEYEITFESGTEISLCTDTDNVPQIKYSFVDLNNLESVEANSMVDVIGVVKETGEVSQITSKATQKPVTKRELTLVDHSGMSVRLTLWGRQAENFSAGGGYNDDGTPQQPVIAFKAVRVGDFNGRSLSMVSSSSMMVDPDIPEGHSLRGWYDSQGTNATFQQYTNAGGGAMGGAGGQMKLSEFKTIGETKDQMLGTGDAPDYFWTRAQLVYIKKENLSYPACPTPRCGKKVMMEEEHSWRCEKCEKNHPAPEYRYILSGQIADFTGFHYFSCFNEVGQVLMGRTADEMEALKNTDEAAFDNAIQEATGQTWNLSVRAKSESYNEQQKIRYNVLKAVPAGFGGEEAQVLINLIKSYGDIQM